MRLPKPEQRPCPPAAGLPALRRVPLKLLTGLLVCQGLAWAVELPLDTNLAATTRLGSDCAPGLSAPACWVNMPVLAAPDGSPIRFDDDLPVQVWQSAVNLDTPVPLDLSVFRVVAIADELLNGVTPDKPERKPDDPQDGSAESASDSWDYELLILLGLGVLAIFASRLRKRRRGNRGVARAGGRVRTRRRVRL